MSPETENQYPHQSAGSLLTAAVPTIRLDETVGDIIKMLVAGASEFASVNYIYALDKDGILKGVISIKDILSRKRGDLIRNLDLGEVVAARSHTDQERVATLAIEHDLESMPVVDKDSRFLGAITGNTLINILHAEAVEDFLKSAGVASKHPISYLITASTAVNVRKRLPWLVLGLAGGMLAAGIVSAFEVALSKELLLAAFIPTVVYMSDAVGTQAQTIFIRALALNRRLSIKNYLSRELRISLVLAASLALLVGLTVTFWLGSFNVGIILAFALFFTTIFAAVIAVILPWLFTKLKLDPAVASGPFATILRDLSSLLIYFGIITLLWPLLN